MGKISIRAGLTAMILITLAGCAAMTSGLKINTPYDWTAETDNYALNAKAGKFYTPYDKVFFATVDMLGAHGFTVKTRDKSSGLIETDIFEQMGVSDFQLTADVRDMSTYTQVKWHLYTILPGQTNAFTGVVTGPSRAPDNDSPDFKQKTNERWDYHLYLQITGKTAAARPVRSLQVE